MPDCPDCGAHTVIVQDEDHVRHTIDAVERVRSGPGRWRIMSWAAQPPLAKAVSETFDGAELVEHALVCKEPKAA